MITEQEKAKELVDKMLYCYQGNIDEYTAKQCAIIAVDEILDNVMMWWELPCPDPYFITQKTYWVNVKKEIQKL
jgi:hypothetical protein